MQKTLAKGITGEQLNVILGTEPLDGEGSDLVKLNIMKLLNEKYGLIESDFQSAELTMVPAGRCREVGLDRSLLAAYGHDDRCAPMRNWTLSSPWKPLTRLPCASWRIRRRSAPWASPVCRASSSSVSSMVCVLPRA